MTTWNLVRGARAGGQRGGHRLVPVARQRALDYVREHRARMGRDGARLGRARRYLDGRPPLPAQLHLQIARYLTRTPRLASGLAPLLPCSAHCQLSALYTTVTRAFGQLSAPLLIIPIHIGTLHEYRVHILKSSL